MTQNEAIASNKVFQCPHNGCSKTDKWRGMTSHLTSAHYWRHSSIDKWREGLPLDLPSVVKAVKSVTSKKKAKKTPPAPKGSSGYVSMGAIKPNSTAFTLADRVRYVSRRSEEQKLVALYPRLGEWY